MTQITQPWEPRGALVQRIQYSTLCTVQSVSGEQCEPYSYKHLRIVTAYPGLVTATTSRIKGLRRKWMNTFPEPSMPGTRKSWPATTWSALLTFVGRVWKIRYAFLRVHPLTFQIAPLELQQVEQVTNKILHTRHFIRFSMWWNTRSEQILIRDYFVARYVLECSLKC